MLAGDSLTNNAYIYFDFNSPVATNSAVTRIESPSSISDFGLLNSDLKLYPNPTANELTVSGYVLANGAAEIKLFNVLGESIFSTRTATSNFKITTLNYPLGVYFVQVGALKAKFVKQ